MKIFNFLLILTSQWVLSSIAIAQIAPSVWDVLRQHFVLNHEAIRPEVQNQVRWIAAHPGYIRNLARKSEPYIYHIISEVNKRRLPGEIALIPMIESAYDPFAYSGAGAAGLWQLMPGTGADLGLKQDWWFDGRRSIRPATNAALSYFSYLSDFFHGDWLLAIAAYDAGEGAISRLVKSNQLSGKNVDFWSLEVPQETKAYIPRLLALAEVIQHPQKYHIQLPDIPHVPYFEEVNVGSQIDLSHAAKLAGISYSELIKLNPGFNRWATAPYKPYKLLIPTERVGDFSRNLASMPKEQLVSWIRHRVSESESLDLIARKYHTTVNLIKELNQLKSDAVQQGQLVLIPSNKFTPIPLHNYNKASTLIPTAQTPQTSHFITTKQYKVLHIVQQNETYPYLQKKYGVSIQDIQIWNHLNAHTPLHLGQQLIIWKKSSNTGTYVVKQGDSLSLIAQQHHTSIESLVRLNPILTKRPIYPGQKITLG